MAYVMNMRIETLRGLACLLLVIYHVVGPTQNYGLRIEDGPVRWLNDGLTYLRMPLFTFLSGLVYGLRPFSGNSQIFLAGKARRLLIPMLVVGTLFAMLQALTPGTNSTPGPWYLLHVYPVAHFWFVESLFWVFLVVWVLERWRMIGDSKSYLLVLALACALYLTYRGWPWFGLAGAIYLMPYFLVGLAFSRFPIEPLLANSRIRLGLAALAIVAVVSMGMPVPNPDRRTAGMLLAGISLCMLCLALGAAVPALARIGRHSYAIFLFHVFFTAFARIGLDRLKIDYMPLDIMMGMTLGLAGPIAIDRIASRFKWPALLLLGKSVKGRSRPKPGRDHLALAR